MHAQNPNRLYVGTDLHDDYLTVLTNDGSYRFVAYSHHIIETSFIPTGETFIPNSHAIVAQKNIVGARFQEGRDTLFYRTKGIQVAIVKKPLKLLYKFQNKVLLSEKRGYVKTDSTEILEFNLGTTEVLYGGGARALGMNRRGNRLELYNKAHYGYEKRSELLNYTMPLVASSKKYMVHFDNAPIGFLDLDSKGDNTLQYETISGRKTYQVIAGVDWNSIIDSYTDLTGKQPLPPRWVLGNFASRFGYHSQREVQDVVAKFRKDSIPLDTVILDIYWFGKDIKGHMGNLEFLKDSFPSPKKMIQDFRSEGIKTVLVTEPFVLSSSKKWEEVVAKDILAKTPAGEPYQYEFYFGNTGLIDIFEPTGKKWFWEIYKKYTDMGIAGWWGDLGEPEVHPVDMYHGRASANEVHNIYGHHWAKLLQDGYQKDFPTQRPFILMRAGAAGSQRFGMIPWSGDVNRSWGGLAVQPEISLQMGMQGLGYMHSDLGGFAGGEVFDSELYTRWLQYGVFQPIFRPHGQEHIAPEPIFHDDSTKELAKRAIELRYQLLPYNYTLAFENHTKGVPLMRPLLFVESDNAMVFENSEAYLWGNNFLVVPIIKAGVTEKEIYFPKGNKWIDFYNDKVYEGGKTHTIPVVSEHIPVFVKGNAFIPMIQTIQTTAEYHLDTFDVHFYNTNTKSKSQSDLYNDDGHTPEAYEKGLYELLSFDTEKKKWGRAIILSKEVGEHFQMTHKKINLVIHNSQKKPSRVKVAGQNTIGTWDKSKKTLTIPVSWKAKQTKITIKLIF